MNRKDLWTKLILKDVYNTISQCPYITRSFSLTLLQTNLRVNKSQKVLEVSGSLVWNGDCKLNLQRLPSTFRWTGIKCERLPSWSMIDGRLITYRLKKFNKPKVNLEGRRRHFLGTKIWKWVKKKVLSSSSFSFIKNPRWVKLVVGSHCPQNHLSNLLKGFSESKSTDDTVQ